LPISELSASTLPQGDDQRWWWLALLGITGILAWPQPVYWSSSSILFGMA
jgi:hypothetical protein